MSHSSSHRASAGKGAGKTARKTAGRRVVLVGLALGLVVGVVAGLVADRLIDSGTSSGSSGVEQDLREIEGKGLRALVDAGMSVAAPLHAKEFTVVSPNGYPMTRDAYLAAVESGDIDYREFEPVSDIEVVVDGDTAVLWYESRIDIVAAGEGRFTHEAWHMYLYDKSNGHWQVVREQATAVGGFPPPGS